MTSRILLIEQKNNELILLDLDGDNPGSPWHGGGEDLLRIIHKLAHKHGLEATAIEIRYQNGETCHTSDLSPGRWSTDDMFNITAFEDGDGHLLASVRGMICITRERDRYDMEIERMRLNDRRDAKRYRWLRDQPEIDRVGLAVESLEQSCFDGHGIRGDDLDAEIDARLKL